MAANSKHPRPPSWLSKHAKAEWKRAIPQLMNRRTITDAEIGTLEMYCVAMGEVRRAHELLKVEPMLVSSPRSAPRPNPAYRLMQTYMTEARRFAVELGLTPASRKRSTAVEDDNDASDWDDLGVK